MKKLNLEGKLFGKLKVAKKSHSHKGDNYWLCICDCGNEHYARTSHLVCGSVWRCKSCKCISLRNKKLCGEISTQFWKQIEVNAKKKKRCVSLTPKVAWKIFEKQNGLCFYTGVLLTFSESSDKQNRYKGTASIDRIDSSKGYTANNIRWVHKTINKMKSDLSSEEFLSWCKKVAQKEL